MSKEERILHEGKPLSELTEAERESLIFDYESEREQIKRELEEIMKRAGKLTRRPWLGKRRRKLGKAPNDRNV